ncbi:hypothetical protein TNCV_4882381 [Trichonephila clavipes]|nr:hypothetical protein TNCV_4882381 [Trichonephila clavipes]
MVTQRLTQITPPAVTPNQLWQRVDAAWSAVPQEHIQSLFESMPRRGSKIILDFDRKSLAIQESQVEDIKIDDGNLRVDLSEMKLSVVANVLDNNTIESIIGEKVNCAIIRDLVLSSRDQLIEEQKTDPELSHIYRYLENPEDSSVNAAICRIGLAILG